jgi:hypothetical protein
VGAALAPVIEVAAAPTWLPAAPVAPAVAGGEAGAVAVDPAGNAVAVWLQTTSGAPQLVASSRPAGATWGPPVPLSPDGTPASHPQVVLERDGRATAVWFAATGPSGATLQSSTRSPGGVWSAAVGVPGETAETAQAALAVRPGASAVVVWPRLVSGLWYVSASTRTPSGSWSIPTDLSAGSTVMPGRPRLAVDGTGSATALWSGNEGGRWTVRAASLSPEGTWHAPVALSSGDQDAVDPAVAIAGNGTAVAVWARWNGADRWVSQSSTRPANATGWTGPVDLSGPGLSVADVEIARDDYGSRYVATWSATSGAPSTPVVQAAVLDQGAWRPAATVSDPAAESTHPTVVVGNSTPAVLSWLATTATGHVVQASVLPRTATSFVSGFALSAADRDAGPPSLTLDPRGDVLAVWGESGPSSFQPRYAAYDVAGPTVRSLKRPGRAVAGHAVTYDATVVDTWSPVATYSWTFGDGSTATGSTTTHVFAEPGRYRLRFRVIDAVGNITTRTSRTKVIPAPAITGFALAERRIRLADRARIRLHLNVPAKVKLVLRSKNRHLVDGVLHRQKLVVKRDLDPGKSTVTLKASRLLADTWVVTAVARTLGVDSPMVKKRLRVVP